MVCTSSWYYVTVRDDFVYCNKSVCVCNTASNVRLIIQLVDKCNIKAVYTYIQDRNCLCRRKLNVRLQMFCNARFQKVDTFVDQVVFFDDFDGESRSHIWHVGLKKNVLCFRDLLVWIVWC